MTTKRQSICLSSLAVGLAVLTGFPSEAHAHIGIVNTQSPYAIAGKSYELVLAVPHGCAYTKSDGSAGEADTYKVEVAIPTGFTAVRPIVEGVFGRAEITLDGAKNVTKLVYTKNASYDSTEDNQSYRIGLRGTAPNAPFTAIQFNTKQYCKNPLGGPDLMTDWSAYGTPATNQSPKVKIFPVRTAGWNKFSLAATNEKHTQADVKALLADFFADAQIVWLAPGTNVGKGGYSANPTTAAKLKTLAMSDPSSYELAERSDVMIHASDVIWAKF